MPTRHQLPALILLVITLVSLTAVVCLQRTRSEPVELCRDSVFMSCREGHDSVCAHGAHITVGAGRVAELQCVVVTCSCPADAARDAGPDVSRDRSVPGDAGAD